MAFYDVEKFRGAIELLLEHASDKASRDFLDGLRGDGVTSYEDPNIAMLGIASSLDDAAECGCPKCAILATFCQVSALRFAWSMKRILDEEDLAKREELVTKEFSNLTGSMIPIMDAALQSYVFILREKAAECSFDDAPESSPKSTVN